MGRRALTAGAGEALAELAGGLPPAPVFGPPPADLEEDWRYYPADWPSAWGDERSAQLAIADTEAAWRRLGFTTKPTVEYRLPSGDRVDRFSAGLIADCKQ